MREHIEEAFRHKEMAGENRRLDLELRTANQELATANRQMEDRLRQKEQQITNSEVSLQIVREIVRHVAIPLIGVDQNNMIAFANHAAERLFANVGGLLGNDVRLLLPELLQTATGVTPASGALRIQRNGTWFETTITSMGEQSQSRGQLISLEKCENQS